MDTKNVFNALSACDEGDMSHYPGSATDYLAQFGLIETISLAEYLNLRSKAESIDGLYKQKGKLEGEITLLKENINELNTRINSDWHRFWTNETKLAQEELDLQNFRNNLSRNEREYMNFDYDIQTAADAADRIADYKETHNGAVKLTEKGIRRLEFLTAGQTTIIPADYESIETHLEQLESKLFSRYNSFRNQAILFSEDDRFGSSENAEYLALAISLRDNPGTLAYAIKIDDYLLANLDCSIDHDERLKIVSVLLNTPEPGTHRLHILKEIYGIALANDHSDSYDTLLEQAFATDIPGKTPAEKWTRYQNMCHELDLRGWSIGSSESCYIAANLATKVGKESEIAEYFRNLELELIDKGIEDSVESGFAALILYDQEGTIQHKADYFMQTWDIMVNQFGWDEDSQFYGSCAMLCYSGGNLHANLAAINYTLGLLEQDEYTFEGDTRHMALDLFLGMQHTALESSKPQHRSSPSSNMGYHVHADGHFRIGPVPYQSSGFF